MTTASRHGWDRPAPLHPSIPPGPGGLTNTSTLKMNIRYFTQLKTPMGTPRGQGSAGRWQRLSLQRGELSPGPRQPRPVPHPGCSATRGGPAHGHRRDRQGLVLREETSSWQVSPMPSSSGQGGDGLLCPWGSSSQVPQGAGTATALHVERVCPSPADAGSLRALEPLWGCSG